MGQVYLEDYVGPLYAFIEVKVSDLTITTQADGQHLGGALGDVDSYITNVTMSLGMTKQTTDNRGGSSWNIGNEFNLNIFDESACYVEEVIAAAMSNTAMGANCRVEYGWSYQGNKIPERSASFEGLIMGYTLSFEGSSTVLSIEGTTVGVFEIGTNYSCNDIPDDITKTGKPSDVVKYICEEVLSTDSGVQYDLSDIEETEVAYMDDDETKPYDLTCNANSIVEYLTNLARVSKSASTGATGYSFWMTQDENNPNLVHVHFRACGADTYFNTWDEKGNLVEEIVYDADRGTTRTYSYYGDSQKSEVLSYSTDFKAFALNAGVSKVSSIDGFTNELISVETGDISIGTVSTAADACRLMGLSSGVYYSLSKCMSDLWTKYAEQQYTATLEIMGDPNIAVMDQIQLDVYTKFHQKHHTSGIYVVKSIDESVDTSGYSTTLNLYKLLKLESRNIGIVEEEGGYKNPGQNARDGGAPSSLDGTPKAEGGGNLSDRGFSNSAGGDNNSAYVNKTSTTNSNQSTANLNSSGNNVNKSSKSAASVTTSSTISTASVNSGAIVNKDSAKGSSKVANPVIYNRGQI